MLCGWDSFLIQMQHYKERVMHLELRVIHWSQMVMHCK